MVTLTPAPPNRGVPGWCPPLTWDTFVHPEGRVIGALLSCVNGHECLLSFQMHAVAADGTVTPSVVCPIKGCTWHEFVRLDGWTP